MSDDVCDLNMAAIRTIAHVRRAIVRHMEPSCTIRRLLGIHSPTDHLKGTCWCKK